MRSKIRTVGKRALALALALGVSLSAVQVTPVKAETIGAATGSTVGGHGGGQVELGVVGYGLEVMLTLRGCMFNSEAKMRSRDVAPLKSQSFKGDDILWRAAYAYRGEFSGARNLLSDQSPRSKHPMSEVVTGMSDSKGIKTLDNTIITIVSKDRLEKAIGFSEVGIKLPDLNDLLGGVVNEGGCNIECRQLHGSYYLSSVRLARYLDDRNLDTGNRLTHGKHGFQPSNTQDDTSPLYNVEKRKALAKVAFGEGTDAYNAWVEEGVVVIRPFAIIGGNTCHYPNCIVSENGGDDIAGYLCDAEGILTSCSSHRSGKRYVYYAMNHGLAIHDMRGLEDNFNMAYTDMTFGGHADGTKVTETNKGFDYDIYLADGGENPSWKAKKDTVPFNRSHHIAGIGEGYGVFGLTDCKTASGGEAAAAIQHKFTIGYDGTIKTDALFMNSVVGVSEKYSDHYNDNSLNANGNMEDGNIDYDKYAGFASKPTVTNYGGERKLEAKQGELRGYVPRGVDKDGSLYSNAGFKSLKGYHLFRSYDMTLGANVRQEVDLVLGYKKTFMYDNALDSEITSDTTQNYKEYKANENSLGGKKTPTYSFKNREAINIYNNARAITRDAWDSQDSSWVHYDVSGGVSKPMCMGEVVDTSDNSDKNKGIATKEQVVSTVLLKSNKQKANQINSDGIFSIQSNLKVIRTTEQPIDEKYHYNEGNSDYNTERAKDYQADLRSRLITLAKNSKTEWACWTAGLPIMRFKHDYDNNFNRYTVTLNGEEAGQKIGVAVQEFVRCPSVQSRLFHMKFRYSNHQYKSSRTVETQWGKDDYFEKYMITEHTGFAVRESEGDMNDCLVVFARYGSDPEKVAREVTDYFRGKYLSSGNLNSFVSANKELFGEVTKYGNSHSYVGVHSPREGESGSFGISVGYQKWNEEKTDTLNKAYGFPDTTTYGGYDVYVFERIDDTPDVPDDEEAEGDLEAELQDYALNVIYPGLLGANGVSLTDNDNHTQRGFTESRGNTTFTHTHYNWNYNISTAESNGVTIEKHRTLSNNSAHIWMLCSPRNIDPVPPLFNTLDGGYLVKRNDDKSDDKGMCNPYNGTSSKIENPEGSMIPDVRTYEYSYNLARGTYGDKRTISGLSYRSTAGEVTLTKDRADTTYGVGSGDTIKTVDATANNDSAATMLYNGSGLKDRVLDTLVFACEWEDKESADGEVEANTDSGSGSSSSSSDEEEVEVRKFIVCKRYFPEDGTLNYVGHKETKRKLTVDNHIYQVHNDYCTQKFPAGTGQSAVVQGVDGTSVDNGTGVLTLTGTSHDGNVMKATLPIKETIYKYDCIGLDGSDADGVKKDSENASADSVILWQNKLTATAPRGMDVTLKYGVVHQNSDTESLQYYPEVGMRFEMAKDSAQRDYKWTTPQVEYMARVLTIGEKQRSVRPSSLYLVKITNGNVPENNVTGETYSDTAGAGSLIGNARTGTQQVIYGGSDVTVEAGTNFGINLYGYALDTVNKDTDNNKVIAESGSRPPYASIVPKDESLQSAWGGYNGMSDEGLLHDFTAWSNHWIKSINADFVLTVGSKVYNNFSSSVGKWTADNSKAEGVYQLYFRMGELDKSVTTGKGYRDLIGQIADDYEVTFNEAEELFKNSDIYKSVLDSLESSGESTNSSQANTGVIGRFNSGTSTVSDGKNWYDEETHTFVIRRFTRENIEFPNIVLSDKLDYNLVPERTNGTSGTDDGQTNYNTYQAKWWLVLYLRDKNNKGNIYSGKDDKIYKPAGGLVNRSGEESEAGDVIIDQVHVNGADFQVPSGVTQDIGR